MSHFIFVVLNSSVNFEINCLVNYEKNKVEEFKYHFKLSERYQDL